MSDAKAQSALLIIWLMLMVGIVGYAFLVGPRADPLSDPYWDWIIGYLSPLTGLVLGGFAVSRNQPRHVSVRKSSALVAGGAALFYAGLLLVYLVRQTAAFDVPLSEADKVTRLAVLTEADRPLAFIEGVVLVTFGWFFKADRGDAAG